jgi:hypothetical protein
MAGKNREDPGSRGINRDDVFPRTEAPALAYLTLFQIIPEERVLRVRLGAEFDDYTKRVRRWA